MAADQQKYMDLIKAACTHVFVLIVEHLEVSKRSVVTEVIDQRDTRELSYIEPHVSIG
jgi:hypothetical protein